MDDQYMQCPQCGGDLVILSDGKRQCQSCQMKYILGTRVAAANTPPPVEEKGEPVTDQYNQCPRCGGDLFLLSDGKRKCQDCGMKYMLVPSSGGARGTALVGGTAASGMAMASGQSAAAGKRGKKKSAIVPILAAVLLIAAVGGFLANRFLFGSDTDTTQNENEYTSASEDLAEEKIPMASTGEAAEGLAIGEGAPLHMMGIVEEVGENFIGLNNGVDCYFDPALLNDAGLTAALGEVEIGDVVGMTGLVSAPSSASFTLESCDVPYIYYDGAKFYNEYEDFRKGIPYPDTVSSTEGYERFLNLVNSGDVLSLLASNVLESFRNRGVVTEDSFSCGVGFYDDDRAMSITGRVERVEEGYFVVDGIYCFYKRELLSEEEQQAIDALKVNDKVTVCGSVCNSSVDAFRMNYCYITEQGQTAAESKLLSDDLPKQLSHSSGMGAWGTELILNRDGRCYGSFHNSDADCLYYSNFEGRFEILEQVDEYTYLMRLTELTLDEEPGTEHYSEDGWLMIASEPSGVEEGEDYYLYLPGTPYELLTEEFLRWNMWGEENNHLSGYALCHVTEEYGFFDVSAENGFS